MSTNPAVYLKDPTYFCASFQDFFRRSAFVKTPGSDRRDNQIWFCRGAAFSEKIELGGGKFIRRSTNRKGEMYHTDWMPEKLPCWTSEKTNSVFSDPLRCSLAKQLAFFSKQPVFSGFSDLCRVENDSESEPPRIPSTGLDAASGDAHLST